MQALSGFFYALFERISKVINGWVLGHEQEAKIQRHAWMCTIQEGPTLDTAAIDQGTEMERRTLTAAVTTIRTDRGHSVRGASGLGNQVNRRGSELGSCQGQEEGRYTVCCGCARG
ncbi:hypothetical protein Vretifemale_1280 [Volvox reticuliferus]|uniref:Uncharacterized protein n=1 Tax=Volvox reticuliferus TaxID=1737510 RepID=A0A8J4C008_9CHLO|nr:hypothetical protein Vretifemale_1280 [Volvox reticuliferus]